MAEAMEAETPPIPVACYHGQLTDSERKNLEKSWTSGDIKVMFATVAFGVGIGDPQVTFVFHYLGFYSLENYHQETGRARNKASVILFVPQNLPSSPTYSFSSKVIYFYFYASYFYFYASYFY